MDEDHTTIIVAKEVKLSKPVLVVGLPGIGNVGKLVAEHLKNEFDGVKLATLYSNHFPHKVIMLKNGGIRLASNRFYYIKSKKKGGSDIVLLIGDDQAITPEGQYEVNTKIVDFFKDELKGSFVYTIGGYTTGEPITGIPRVYGNATSKEVVDSFKGTKVLFGQSKGMIWGSAGLIIAFAKRSKIDGVCLMGETSFVDLDAVCCEVCAVGAGGAPGTDDRHKEPRPDNNKDRAGDKRDRAADDNGVPWSAGRSGRAGAASYLHKISANGLVVRIRASQTRNQLATRVQIPVGACYIKIHCALKAMKNDFAKDYLSQFPRKRKPTPKEIKLEIAAGEALMARDKETELAKALIEEVVYITLANLQQERHSMEHAVILRSRRRI